MRRIGILIHARLDAGLPSRTACGGAGRAHKACAAGQYESKAAETHADRECAACPAGFKCDGSATQTACRAADNEFQNDTGMAGCNACASCPDGQIRTGCGGSSPGTCTTCGAGYVKAGRFACKVCAPGTFEVGHMQCTACTAGRHSQEGATGCMSCAEGLYQPDAGTSQCLQTP